MRLDSIVDCLGLALLFVVLVGASFILRRMSGLGKRVEELSRQVQTLELSVDRLADRIRSTDPSSRKPVAPPVAASVAPPPAPTQLPPVPARAMTPPPVPAPTVVAGPEHAAPRAPSITPPPYVSRPVPEAPPRDETWEAVIGSSWLNRIGVAMLVLGITFALGYTLTRVGPLGKASIATAVSSAMIAGGVVLERLVRYRFYARGLIGGGWAALYATAYAVHGLAATRIVEDPRAGFLLLVSVGSGMIVHSLRYRNEGLTAVAYSLAYGAIVLHSLNPFTLVAATVLGIGTVLHLLRREWYFLALGGLVATYGSLFLWHARQVDAAPATLRLTLWALAIIWLVFLAADFLLRPRDHESRFKGRLVGVLNAVAVAVLADLAWTDVHPQMRWPTFAVLGAAYAITSLLLRLRDRPAAHQMHSLAASLLVAVAAGTGLSVVSATWVWLAEAQLIVLIGLYLRDSFHRWLGSVLFLVPAAAVILEQGLARAGRVEGGLDLRRLALNAAACASFYFTHARLALTDTDATSRTVRRAFSHGAFVLIVLALWVQLPRVWVGPALALLLLLLFELSARWRERDLRIQAWLASLGAVLAAAILSGRSATLLATLHARIPALVVVAAALLVAFLRLAHSNARLLDEDAALRRTLPWLAAGLAALSVWLDATPTMVGPLWLGLALVLVEAGLLLGEADLRRPGTVLLFAAHVALVLSNLTSVAELGGLSVRTATILPSIAATYYVWWRLRERGRERWDEATGRALSYVAAAVLGLWSRFEFGLDGAALRWSVAMLALLLLAHVLRDADFRLQAYLLGAATLIRAVGFDFRHADPVLGLDGPLTIAAVCAAAYVVAGFHLRSRAGTARADRRTIALEARCAPRGAEAMWLAATALAALYFYRTQSGSALIVAWALVGLIVTTSGFTLRTFSLRVAGLVLLGLAVVLTLVRAVTTFDTLGRIVSFTILGLVLLLVSFGYTRYRDRFRRNE